MEKFHGYQGTESLLRNQTAREDHKQQRGQREHERQQQREKEERAKRKLEKFSIKFVTIKMCSTDN